MVSAPRTVISAAPARQFLVSDLCDDGYSDDRLAAVSNAALKWYNRFGGELPESFNGVEDLKVELKITNASPRHSGLGSGTQLAMATGLALQQFWGLPIPKPDELAVGLSRATRSAVGTYGCLEGGLIVDHGKTVAESVSPIDLRVDFPGHWPIAIVRIKGEEKNAASSSAGLYGGAEAAAFEKIKPTTELQLQEMRSIVAQQLVPGVLEENYPKFASAVHQFGRRSGEYFSEVQGGPYASEVITEVVQTIHDAEVHATGQSSWGPSVFAIGKSWEHLQPAIARLKKRFGANCHIEITHADNEGIILSQQSHISAGEGCRG